MSIEQISNAIVFYAFYVASKVGKTGIAVTVDVYNPAGAEIVTAGAAVEVGDGLYSYTLAGGSTANVGEYICIFKTADTTVDQQHIPALWVVGRAGVEYLDAAVSSRSILAAGAQMDLVNAPNATAITAIQAGLAVPGDAMALTAGGVDAIFDELLAGHVIAGSAGAALLLIGAGGVLTVSPVASDGDLELYGADDYFDADLRALDWTDSSAAWPDLTGASITLYVRAPDGTKFNAAGSVVVPVGPPKKVRVELTSAQTATLLAFPMPSEFRVRSTLLGGHKVTLVAGIVTVADDIA